MGRKCGSECFTGNVKRVDMDILGDYVRLLKPYVCCVEREIPSKLAKNMEGI